MPIQLCIISIIPTANFLVLLPVKFLTLLGAIGHILASSTFLCRLFQAYTASRPVPQNGRHSRTSFPTAQTDDHVRSFIFLIDISDVSDIAVAEGRENDGSLIRLMSRLRCWKGNKRVHHRVPGRDVNHIRHRCTFDVNCLGTVIVGKSLISQARMTLRIH